MEIAIIIILVIVIILFVGACAYTGMDPASLALTLMLVCIGMVVGAMGAKAYSKYQEKKAAAPAPKKEEVSKAVETAKEAVKLTKEEVMAKIEELSKLL